MNHAIEKYNQLFEAKALKWKRLNVEHLPQKTMRYLHLVFAAGIDLEVAEQSPIKDTYLFRLKKQFHGALYLVHDSVAAGHIWADENFENLDPTEVGDKVIEAAIGRPFKRRQP